MEIDPEPLSDKDFKRLKEIMETVNKEWFPKMSKDQRYEAMSIIMNDYCRLCGRKEKCYCGSQYDE